MDNVVEELDVLKKKTDLEATLREAVDLELRNNIENGPMRQAHDASIEAVVDAARALVTKADGG
jgi:hypothetical protein